LKLPYQQLLTEQFADLVCHALNGVALTDFCHFFNAILYMKFISHKCNKKYQTATILKSNIMAIP